VGWMRRTAWTVASRVFTRRCGGRVRGVEGRDSSRTQTPRARALQKAGPREAPSDSDDPQFVLHIERGAASFSLPCSVALHQLLSLPIDPDAMAERFPPGGDDGPVRRFIEMSVDSRCTSTQTRLKCALHAHDPRILYPHHRSGILQTLGASAGSIFFDASKSEAFVPAGAYKKLHRRLRAGHDVTM
jgi:hypothetical protein